MKVKAEAKKPRGRPPTHAILVDGQWQLTAESFELRRSALCIADGAPSSAIAKCETSCASSTQS